MKEHGSGYEKMMKGPEDATGAAKKVIIDANNAIAKDSQTAMGAALNAIGNKEVSNVRRRERLEAYKDAEDVALRLFQENLGEAESNNERFIIADIPVELVYLYTGKDEEGGLKRISGNADIKVKFPMHLVLDKVDSSAEVSLQFQPALLSEDKRTITLIDRPGTFDLNAGVDDEERDIETVEIRLFENSFSRITQGDSKNLFCKMICEVADGDEKFKRIYGEDAVSVNTLLVLYGK